LRVWPSTSSFAVAAGILRLVLGRPAGDHDRIEAGADLLQRALELHGHARARADLRQLARQDVDDLAVHAQLLLDERETDLDAHRLAQLEGLDRRDEHAAVDQVLRVLLLERVRALEGDPQHAQRAGQAPSQGPATGPPSLPRYRPPPSAAQPPGGAPIWRDTCARSEGRGGSWREDFPAAHAPSRAACSGVTRPAVARRIRALPGSCRVDPLRLCGGRDRPGARMRILLINPSYPFEEFPRLLVTLPYVAAALRAAGHEVEILDLLLSRTTPDKIERRMQRLRPQLVGITSVTLNHHIANAIGEVVRKCDGACPIVMGGPHVSFEIEGSFRDLPALDYVGIGEGEHTMVELARALEGRMDLRDVRGLALRHDGGIKRTAPRPLEDDLDRLPPPARDLVPLARYLAFDSHASVVTSRGCPYECIFCSAPAWTGRSVRYRTPSLCVDEIEELAAQGFREITIEDDLFTLYRKHFMAVCGELVRRDTGIRWNAFSRVDTISPEIVETMARAGCQAICFGVESGSQEVLDLVKKRSSLDKVKEAMRMTQDVGISALASFIIGLPGETEETLRKTVEFANELHQEFGSLYGFHILSPFPGTEVRDKASEYGLEILTSDWTQYDANHVVTRTPGADRGVIQSVADEYEQTMERYLRYQDWLFAQGRLEGYERQMYLRRRRQSLLWQLLLNDTIESLPAFRGDPPRELEAAIAAATGVAPDVVAEETARVLALRALVGEPTPEGVRYAWSE
jgi:radical SAM superfamily enzyme YgiQ (UPF0313 family)